MERIRSYGERLKLGNQTSGQLSGKERMWAWTNRVKMDISVFSGKNNFLKEFRG